jgi:CNT family concentrative nucleoside transporter
MRTDAMNTLNETARTSPVSPLAAPDPDAFTMPVGVFRFWLFLGTLFLTCYAYWSAPMIGPRGQALCGIAVILGMVALCSRDLAAVNWRPLFFGFSLQLFLAMFITKFEITGMDWAGIPDGTRPGYELFKAIADGLAMFLQFSQRGIEFIFGALVNRDRMREVFGRDTGPIFAFAVLPILVFVSSFFSILY